MKTLEIQEFLIEADEFYSEIKRHYINKNFDLKFEIEENYIYYFEIYPKNAFYYYDLACLQIEHIDEQYLVCNELKNIFLPSEDVIFIGIEEKYQYEGLNLIKISLGSVNKDSKGYILFKKKIKPILESSCERRNEILSDELNKILSTELYEDDKLHVLYKTIEYLFFKEIKPEVIVINYDDLHKKLEKFFDNKGFKYFFEVDEDYLDFRYKNHNEEYLRDFGENQNACYLQLEKVLFPEGNFSIIDVRQWYDKFNHYRLAVKDKNTTKPLRKFSITWEDDWITAYTITIDCFIYSSMLLGEKFKRWKEEGIFLDNEESFSNFDATRKVFSTFNEDVAKKEGFIHIFDN